MRLIDHEVIRASAGTGKTFALSSRYLVLLREGAQPQSILATTFTRKAAGEILERVLARLATGAKDQDGADRMKNELGDRSLTLAHCRTMLAEVCRSLHRVSISTIDAFFNRIAQSFRHELGIPPQAQLVDDENPRVAVLRRQAIDALLAEDSPQVLLDLVNRLHHDTAQRSVTGAIDAIVSGLYETYRQAPDSTLWAQLAAPKPLDAGALQFAIGGLERLAAGAIPKRMAGALAVNVGAARAGDWEAFLEKGLAPKIDDAAPAYYKTPIPEVICSAYRPLIDHAKAITLDRCARQTQATFDLLRRFDAHYTPLRQAQRLMLFSDLTHKLARELPRRGDDLLTEVYYRLDTHVTHLLLDEFQDTSLEQWSVLRPFAEEIVAHGEPQSSGRSFFCVGDVKQAIYGWRGGCAEIFDQIEHDLHLPPGVGGGTRLSESYRSSQFILDAVNTVFGSIGANPALKEHAEVAERWQESFLGQTAHRDLPGYVELISSPAPQNGAADMGDDDTDISDAGNGDKDVVAPTDSHAVFSAQKIAELSRDTPGHSIGVLVGTNKFVNQLIFLLRREGIEASGEGGTPVTDDPAVNVILAALTMADHPGDTIARFHVLHSPLAVIIGLTSMDVGQADTAATAIRRALLVDGYARVIAAWTRGLAPSCNARGAQRLTQLVELADRYDADATLRPSAFVDFVTATPVEEPSPAAVRVMTVHKAKGLEFDVVVLPQLDRRMAQIAAAPVYVVRSTPTGPITAVHRAVRAATRSLSPQLAEAWQQEVTRRLQDDLCNLYVAMTRPRYALHLILKPLRPKKGGGPRAEGLTNLCAAAILRQALPPPAPDEPTWRGDDESCAGGETLYELGDPDWSQKLDQRTPQTPRSTQPAVQPQAADTGKLIASPVVTAPAEPQTAAWRSWRQVTPSSLESAGVVRAADLLAIDPSPAAMRGTIIHAWFALIEYLPPAPGVSGVALPDDELLRQVAQREAATDPGFTPALVTALIADFRAMLRQPTIQRALGRPAPGGAGVGLGEPELWRERPFAVHLGDQLLVGRFDRVLVYRRGTSRQVTAAEILDYKTDRIEPGGSNLSERIARYRPQLHAYRRALAAMMALDPARIKTQLLLVDGGYVRDVG